MRKLSLKVFITFILILAVLSNTDILVSATSKTTSEIVEAALVVIYQNEGTYGTVNADDNGAVSVGKLQWHATRALNLLKTIVEKNPSSAKSILGNQLFDEIRNSSNWETRTVSTTEKNALSQLLNTSEGRAAQDSLANTDVTSYVNHGINLGIEAGDALVYFSDLENQGGLGMAKRVAATAAKQSGSYSSITLDSIHQAALSDSVAASYSTRRTNTYSYCKNLNWNIDPNIKSSFSCSITSPSGTITANNKCVVEGTVSSARTITKITAWVENSSGKTIISASCNPGGTTYSFARSVIDNNLLFQNITENGQYFFKVTISDDKTTSNTFSFPFNVTGGTSPVQRPGKSELTNMSSTYISGEPIVFSWKSTSDTTHYNVYIQENSSGSWKTLKHIKYAENGITSWTLSEGNYRAAVQSYNSNGWESDHSDWLHTESDYVYFTVIAGKPSNVKVVTDKTQYELGETVTITPSATGAKGFNMRICYGEYGDNTTVFSDFSSFTGSKTYTPDRPGTYIVRASALGGKDYTDAECTFVVTEQTPFTPDPVTPTPVPDTTTDTLTVYYDANGGSGAPDAQTKEAGTAVTIQSKIPERFYIVSMDNNMDVDSGSKLFPLPYITASFTGWNTKQDGTGTSYSAGSSYTADESVTLYAQWAPGTIETLYTLSFNNGDKVFDGWYTAPQGGTKVSEGATVTGDMTIYAHWRAATDPVAVDQEGVHFEQQTIYFQGQFTDVPADKWFTESVASAFEYSLMKGNSDTTFNPYGDVTIAEAITMASRIHSIYTTGGENFVQSGVKWYQVYLDYAYQNGIINKAYYNCDVTRTATRVQFAEIFSNSMPDKALYPMNTIGENAIPDVNSSANCAPFVYKLYRAGILSGNDAKGTFSPESYITRAESAAIVSRMAESNNRVVFSLQ